MVTESKTFIARGAGSVIERMFKLGLPAAGKDDGTADPWYLTEVEVPKEDFLKSNVITETFATVVLK